MVLIVSKCFLVESNLIEKTCHWKENKAVMSSRFRPSLSFKERILALITWNKTDKWAPKTKKKRRRSDNIVKVND